MPVFQIPSVSWLVSPIDVEGETLSEALRLYLNGPGTLTLFERGIVPPSLAGRHIHTTIEGVNFCGVMVGGADFSGSTFVDCVFPTEGWPPNVNLRMTTFVRCAPPRERLPANEPEEEPEEQNETLRWVEPRSAVGRGRLVGAEVEFNSCDSESSLMTSALDEGHGIHEDGSCGWELVTRPMTPAGLAQTMAELRRAFDSCEVDSRCGVHIHVSAKDLRWADVRTLVALYSRCEPLLYILCGQKRANEKRYARPIRLYEKMLGADWKSDLVCDIFEESPRYAIRKLRSVHKKDSCRYRGLNLAPWLAGRKKGRADTTIEFRSHKGTKDLARVASWARLCWDMVEWSSTHEARDVPLFGGQLEALCHVSPASREWILGRIKAWRAATRHSGETPRLITYTPASDFTFNPKHVVA